IFAESFFPVTSLPLAPLATENAIAVRPADKSRRDAARIVGTAPRQSNGRWWHALPSPLTQNPPPPAPAPVAHLPRRCWSPAESPRAAAPARPNAESHAGDW